SARCEIDLSPGTRIRPDNASERLAVAEEREALSCFMRAACSCKIGDESPRPNMQQPLSRLVGPVIPGRLVRLFSCSQRLFMALTAGRVEVKGTGNFRPLTDSVTQRFTQGGKARGNSWAKLNLAPSGSTPKRAASFTT